MSGAPLRSSGAVANYAPVIKRGIATLTDGRVATLVIDPNTTAVGGVDVTGVAKICVYLSSDASRTTHALAINYTPPVAPCSATRYPVASMTVSANNTLFIVWQGVDNGLYVSRWTYSAGVFTFVSTQTLNSSSAIVNKFRCVDIDVAGNDRPVVIAYEAGNTSGEIAAIRIRLLNSDNTTWSTPATLSSLQAGQFIKANSEDVCIAWRGDGVVSNSGRVLFYATQTAASVDKGDIVRELILNVSAGTATVAGTWYTTMHAKNASGSRRAMIFTLSNSLYLLCGVYGTTTPRFWATKLTSGIYTAPAITYAGYVSSIALSGYFKIDATSWARSLWSATYKDNRLSFGFVGVGTVAGTKMLREIIFTYPNVTTVSAKPTIDQVPRPLYGELNASTYKAIALYGGDNRRLSANLKYYNYVAIYFTANITPLTYKLQYDFVAEDTFNPPHLVSPIDAGPAEPTNTPVFRVRVDNDNLTPNLYGKLQVQVATDTGFTTDVKTITQPDSALQYFGNKDGLSGAGKIVSVQATLPPEYLYTGPWYWRARIVSDKDTPGEWSTYYEMEVLHPPIAKPLTPAKGIILAPVNPYIDNMVSNGDAGLANTNFQTGFNGALSYSTTQSHTAPGSFRLVPSGSGTDAQVLTPMYPTTPGQQFTATGWIRPDTVNKSVRIQVNYYDASNAFLGSVNTTQAAVTGTWTQLSVTAPSAAFGSTVASVQLAIGVTGSPAVGDAFYADDLTLRQSSGDVMFSWSFSDTEPTDTQSEYNLTVVRQDTGAAVVATGWVVSSTKSVSKVFDESLYEIPLTWNVQLKDIDGTAGVASPDQDFTLGYVPLVTVVSPEIDEVVTTATPTITWNYSSQGLREQKAYRIVIVDTFDSQIVADTLWRIGAETSYTFPTNVVNTGGIYDLQVMVIDSAGLYDEAYSHFDTDWIEPALGDITVALDSMKARITWTDVNKDDDFVSWRVYRKYLAPAAPELDTENTATTWVLLHETADDLTSYQYDDYLYPLNKSVSYLVVQVADRFGSIIESDLGPGVTVQTVGDKYYFVPEAPVGTIASYESTSVTGDNFTRDIEQETLHVVGRGRQVQVGDDLGYSGTLTLKFRNPSTARINREFLERLSWDSNKVYIKTPFGDVVLVSLGSIQTNRQPGYGGGADIVDVTVPYLQVIAPDVITRSV